MSVGSRGGGGAGLELIAPSLSAERKLFQVKERLIDLVNSRDIRGILKFSV